MRITTMLADAFGRAVSFLPNLLAALIMLAVGLFVAKVLEKLTLRGLTAVGLDRRPTMQRLVGQNATHDATHDATLRRVPSIGARLVYWVLALVTVGVAVDALHLTWLSLGVARVIGYLPNVLAAGAICVAGFLAGNFLYREVSRKEGASILWARLARGAILALAVFMALQQLGIATAIVTIAFTVGLSALAVAGALAFGLGNRELAGRVTRDWYERRGQRYRRFDPTTAGRTLDERQRDERARDEEDWPGSPQH